MEFLAFESGTTFENQFISDLTKIFSAFIIAYQLIFQDVKARMLISEKIGFFKTGANKLNNDEDDA
jgi:hypothetical protein